MIHEVEIQDLAKRVAKDSIRLARVEDGALPLDKDCKKTLVVEQLTHYRPNDMHGHPGKLWASMLEHNRSVSYFEADTMYSDENISDLEDLIPNFDTIILTNFFSRGRLPATERVSRLLQIPGKKFIVVSNQPFDWIVPENASTVIVSYSSAAPSLEALANALYSDPDELKEMQLL